MSKELRRTLDRYTGGALSAMNDTCKSERLQGYITVAKNFNEITFIFTAYHDGVTRYFNAVRVPEGAETLAAEVELSELFRQLRKAGFLLNPAPPAPTCWS